MTNIKNYLNYFKKTELDETLVYKIPDIPPVVNVLSPVDPPPALNPLICCAHRVRGQCQCHPLAGSVAAC